MGSWPDTIAAHVNLDAVRDWMDGRGLGIGPITDPRVLTGGTQNILIRFTRSGEDYVFRRTPPTPRRESNEVLRREARVLAALSESAVPHPTLIASEPDETKLGYVFFLMAPIEGFNPSEGLPELHRSDAAMRRRMGLSYIEGLAALAEVDYRAAGLEGYGKPDGFLERQVGRWLAQLDSYTRHEAWPGPESLPRIDRLADWLERNRPKDFAPGIIHGDCHLANTMFDHRSGELAALIDWEVGTIGDPRLDLGLVMASWPVLGDEDGPPSDTIGIGLDPLDGFADLNTLIAHYGAQTSRPLDAVNWFGALAGFKLAILLEGTYARSLSGRAPAEIGQRLHAMALSLLRRAEYFAAL